MFQTGLLRARHPPFVVWFFGQCVYSSFLGERRRRIRDKTCKCVAAFAFLVCLWSTVSDSQKDCSFSPLLQESLRGPDIPKKSEKGLLGHPAKNFEKSQKTGTETRRDIPEMQDMLESVELLRSIELLD